MRLDDLVSGPALRGSQAKRLRPAGRTLPVREKRTCAQQGCHTVLSRYNLSEVCAAHGGWADAKSS